MKAADKKARVADIRDDALAIVRESGSLERAGAVNIVMARRDDLISGAARRFNDCRRSRRNLAICARCSKAKRIYLPASTFGIATRKCPTFSGATAARSRSFPTSPANGNDYCAPLRP